MYCDNQVPAGIIADKKGCNTMVSFTESGINMDRQGRYEVFDRIYEEGMREKKVERDRNNR